MLRLIVWLLSWQGRRRTPVLAHLHFQVYTRRGCHLCEAAWQLLQKRQKRYHFALEAVDIDAAGEMASRYGEWVPVVVVNGKERFRGGVNPVLLDRLLSAEGRSAGAEA